MTNLINLQTENKRLKQELTHLQNYAKNLEETLEKIKSAKAFKLWQKINKIKKFLLNLKNKDYLNESLQKIKRLFFFIKKNDFLIINYKLKIFLNKDIIQIPKLLENIRNKNNKNIKVDIIIPWYGDLNLINLLKNIQEFDSVFLNKVFVINDGYPKKEINIILENFIEKINFNKIKYLINKKNLGFVQTCNIGMRLSKHDVILLNSDTKVSYRWIDKLIKVAYSDKKIASVTPLSNNATIFSFPKFNQINKPTNNPNKISNILEKITPLEYIPAPTMHGFCCLIKRKYLKKYGFFDEVFGKGYGEENDLSLRFEKNNLLNVMAINTYITHYETKSFLSEEKKELINEHIKIINKKYPYYIKKVFDFINKKPINFLINLYNIYLKNRDIFEKPINLIILHTNPFKTIGGIESEVLKLIKINKNKNIILYYLDLTKNKYEVVFIFKNKIFKILNFEENSNTSHLILDYLLKTFKIKNIIVEHLKNHNMNEYLKKFRKLKKIKKTLLIHDYFYINKKIPQPLYNTKEFNELFDGKKIYCYFYDSFDRIIFSSEMLKEIYINKFNLNKSKKINIYYPL